MRSKKLISLFRNRDSGYTKYATADGAPASLPQIDAENLLKAADALDNDSYWDVDGVTVTEPSTGVFRLTKTAAADKYISQTLTNWFPKWAGTFSVEVTATSDDLTAGSVVLLVDGTDAVTAAEVVSGNANVAVASSIANITGIDSGDSVIRVTGVATGWATSIVARYYPDKANTTAGYIDVSLSQMILGDQAKPRPVGAGLDDWMLAYRPHNRLTADGNARYSVTDTEGLVSCGEATDILFNPVSADTSTHEAKVRATFSFTYEATKEVNLWLSHSTAGGEGGVRFRVNTSGDLYISDREDGAGDDLYSDVGAFSDGVFYRGEMIVDTIGKTVSVSVDDATVLSDEAYTNASATTELYITHNLAANDIVITTESYPQKSTGIIIAGGKATPAYGDPGIWLTEPDGSAFAVGASDAVMFTAKTFVAAKDAGFGFDSFTSGVASSPNFRLHNSNILCAEVAGVRETPKTWTAGTEKTFMQLLRSDTHGSQFLLHDSGKQWKRFNVNADAIPAASAYPCVSNYNALLVLKNFALLDLSPLHNEEWVGGGSDLGGKLGATDRVATPADEDTYTHDNDFLAILRGVTLPATGNMEFNFRQSGADEITLRIDDTGATTLLDNGNADVGPVAGATSDTEDVMLECVVAAGEVFVEGASIGSSSSLSITTGSGGKRDDSTNGAATAIELWPKTVNLFKV